MQEKGDDNLDIKVVKSGFAEAKSKQSTAIEKLRTYYDQQQAALSAVNYSWKGASGTSFQQCSREMSRQALMVMLRITILNMQTTSVQSNFEETDRLSSIQMAK